MVKAVDGGQRCESGFMVSVYAIVLPEFPDGYQKSAEYVDSNWLRLA